MSHTLLSLDISFEKLVKGLEIANASVSETDTNTSTTFVSQFFFFWQIFKLPEERLF